jgi:hypothetical protein
MQQLFSFIKKFTIKKLLTILLLVCGTYVVSGCYGPPPRAKGDLMKELNEQRTEQLAKSNQLK